MQRFLSGLVVLMSVLSGNALGQLSISEVLYDPVGVDDGAELIELHNAGGSTLDLSQWALCLNDPPPADRYYYQFAAGRMLAAGAHLALHWRAAGVGDSSNAFTSSEGAFLFGLGSTPLDNSEFALGVYFDSTGIFSPADFANASRIKDFVQVGGINLLRESVALAAGIWTNNDMVLGRPEGTSIVWDGTGDASSDYFGDPGGFVAGDNGIATNSSATYGVTCSGSGGFSASIPIVDATPTSGTIGFQLSLGGGPGGALMLVVIGFAPDNFPFGSNGCELAVAAPLTFVGPFSLANAGDGEGTFHAPLINVAPGAGDGYFTYLIADPGVPGLIATNGLRINF